MPRRLSLILCLGVLFILLVSSLFFSGSISHIPKPGPVNFPPGSPKNPASHSSVDTTGSIKLLPFDGSLHIALTETGGSHDEVVAAFVHSFGSQPRAQMDIYQLLPRYGIKDVMNTFELPHKLPKPRAPRSFLSWKEPEQGIPDIWVSTTCELDLINYSSNMTMLLETGKTYIFCVIHHADRWGGQKIKDLVIPWVDKKRIEFVALSPHTAEYLQKEGLSQWNTNVPPLIRYLVPVFPVDIEAEHHHTGEGEVPPTPTGETEELGFALQGDYNPSRRDYKSLFSRLEIFLRDAKTTAEKGLTMHLLGHGANKPTVPKSIKSHVEFDERLWYIEFYTIISRQFALLPAFASADYLDRKASSSVPAALIAGCPLVATQAMVDAYAYLNLDVVWLQKEGQTDIDVVSEVLKLHPEERQRKKQQVRERRDEIIKGNVKRVAEWITEAMHRMGRSA